MTGLFDDENDFITDDLVKPKPARRRNADGKRKGNRTELGLVKLLTTRFGSGFSRSVGSGNRWGQVSYLPKHAQDVFSGDLIVPPGFKWVVESKGGYTGIDLNAVLVRGSRELDGFLEQVAKDAARCGRKPMVCWKRDRRPWLAVVPTAELAGHALPYCLQYREWTVADLETLLALPDDFFLG